MPDCPEKGKYDWRCFLVSHGWDGKAGGAFTIYDISAFARFGATSDLQVAYMEGRFPRWAGKRIADVGGRGSQRLLQAYNESESQPQFNLSLAKVCFHRADPKLPERRHISTSHIERQKLTMRMPAIQTSIRNGSMEAIRQQALLDDTCKSH